MNILFVTSEAVPLAKTGGLADVAGALPAALKSSELDISVIMPKYNSIPQHYLEQFELVAVFYVQFGWRNQYCGLMKGEVNGVTFYLLDNEYYFKRDGLYGYDDDAERFVFFSVAVMEAIPYLHNQIDIVHCNDWQSGLIPFLMKTKYAYHEHLRNVKSIMTIHNIKYQGRFDINDMKDLLGIGDEHFTSDGLEFYGTASCMKAGLQYADLITTVSPTYAYEIQTEYFGEGMDSILRYRSQDLVGIINGIDEQMHNPMNNPHIVTPYRNSLKRKEKNKLDLQSEMGLPQDGNIPLIGVVSRLVEQKGFDLIMATLDELMQENVQMIVLGNGEYKYEKFFYEASLRYPNSFRLWLGFNDRMASRIYAGSDIYAMPSRFEPCGLSQLIALSYRTVPVVRETGGLRDTIIPFNEFTFQGNGFSFANYNAHEYLFTMKKVLQMYHNKPLWKRIVDNGSRKIFNWDSSAKQYENLYRKLNSNRKGIV